MSNLCALLIYNNTTANMLDKIDDNESAEKVLNIHFYFVFKLESASLFSLFTHPIQWQLASLFGPAWIRQLFMTKLSATHNVLEKTAVKKHFSKKALPYLHTPSHYPKWLQVSEKPSSPNKPPNLLVSQACWTEVVHRAGGPLVE